LLESERDRVDEIARRSRSLRISLGWHYRLDVAWILRELPAITGERILDAGAGLGISQWLFADRGANVLSVDRLDRSSLPLRFRLRYPVSGLHDGDIRPIGSSIVSDLRKGAFAVDVRRNATALGQRVLGKGPPGDVTLSHLDLADLSAIATASVDHVVSVSSLEHNELDQLPAIYRELWRVLRPSGVMAVTVGAARDGDWFHAPSAGWCFSEATIRRVFEVDDAAFSNFDRYDEILDAVRASDELRTSLARSYFRSGRNGMPWGRWDPMYLSVGVRRQKPG
jgi:SAM-dependent methyltransferase